MPVDHILDEALEMECYNTVLVDDYFTFNPSFYCNGSSFGIIQFNIRSLNCNFQQLEYYIYNSKCSYDIIVCTECWLSDEREFFYNLVGYKHFIKKNKLNKCDAICVYIKNEIEADIVEAEIDHSNSAILNISLRSASILLICVYRSPAALVGPFLDGLDDVLKNLIIRFGSHEIIWAGDLNINLITNNSTTLEYSSILQLNGFKSFINKPTRVQNNSQSCIDHFFLRRKNICLDNVTGTIFKTCITDHYAVSLHFNLEYVTGRNEYNHSLCKINYDSLKIALSEENWESLLYSVNDDVNLLVDGFLDKVKTLISQHTYKRFVPHKYKPLTNWISKGLIVSIRKRDKMHRVLLKDPSNSTLKTQYKTYRNLLNVLIKKAKINYYNDRLSQCKDNSRMTWKCISELLNKGRKDIKPRVNPETLNKHFSEVGANYANNLRSKYHDVLISAPGYVLPIPANDRVDSFFLRPTNITEIVSTIHSLKNNSAPGIDNISNTCLKNIALCISAPLEYIINKCFEQGIFPNKFKTAKIKPLFKAGDSSNPGNYRPISLLSSFSKVMEKIIKKRVIDYLNSIKFLESMQYGFQSGKSTQDAVLKLIEIVSTNFDKRVKSLAVFLDLEKAFDTIPHDGLLMKLESMGIRGTPLRLFSSYLEGRKQVLVSDNNTDVRNLSNYGLPQGTVLSPILFVIYVNDLLRLNLINGRVISFADDTALIFSGGSWEEVFDFAESGLRMAQSWMIYNTLTVNHNKTKYITFSPTARDQPPGVFNLLMHSPNCNELCSRRVNCNCPVIDSVKCMKYLGVIIDSHMRWDSHLNYTCSRLKYLILCFYKINQLKDINIIKKIYFAYAQSILQYNILAWGGALNTHFNKLFTVQKHIIRAAFGKPRRYHSRLLFEEFGVLTLRQIYIKNLIVYINKNRNLFIPRQATYQLRASSTSSYEINITPLTVCRRQFIYMGSRIINIIPEDFIFKSLNVCTIREITMWTKNRFYFVLEQF
jgi:hypothetical protein